MVNSKTAVILFHTSLHRQSPCVTDAVTSGSRSPNRDTVLQSIAMYLVFPNSKGAGIDDLLLTSQA